MVKGAIDTAWVAERLLEALRQHAADQRLDYRAAPEPILGGNETTIFGFELDVETAHPLAGRLIARIFFDQPETRQHQAEAIIHAHLSALNFPVPTIHVTSDDGGLGAPWVVMTRLTGTMLGSEALEIPRGLLRLRTALVEVPKTLAELHARLHALDPTPLRQALVDLAGSAAPFTPAGQIQAAHDVLPDVDAALHEALDYMAARLAPEGPPVICHGDFHPLNVLVDGTTPTGVIDWGKVSLAERELDVGSTLALLELTGLNLPPLIRTLAEHVLHRMGARYLEAYQARAGAVDLDRVRYFYVLRALIEIAYQRAHGMIELGDIGGWNLAKLARTIDQYAGTRVAALLD